MLPGGLTPQPEPAAKAPTPVHGWLPLGQLNPIRYCSRKLRPHHVGGWPTRIGSARSCGCPQAQRTRGPGLPRPRCDPLLLTPSSAIRHDVMYACMQLKRKRSNEMRQEASHDGQQKKLIVECLKRSLTPIGLMEEESTADRMSRKFPRQTADEPHHRITRSIFTTIPGFDYRKWCSLVFELKLLQMQPGCTHPI